MKKNVMLKIASVLMVAVLLTTCAISSTFAKYVDSGETIESVSARVAKWGITISTETTNKVPLFLREYKNGNDITVQGATETDIVLAPGTTNSDSKFKITVTGTPEVSYMLKAKANLALANWEDKDGKYYCPLKITVTDGKNVDHVFYGNDAEYADHTEFEAAVEACIIDCILAPADDQTTGVDDGYTTLTYAPNTAVPATANGITVTWEWAFEALSGQPNPQGQDDVKDTWLGDQMNATIAISYSVAAEQVD